MKVVHQEKENLSGRELFKKAIEIEEDGPVEDAVPLYKRMIRIGYKREHAYRRLMIIYSKLKEYKKELAIVNESIDTFSDIIFKSKRLHTKKVESISQKLISSLQVSGKNGRQLHDPQPLAGWKIRKKRLEKILEKK